jgi:hypothetical protein
MDTIGSFLKEDVVSMFRAYAFGERFLVMGFRRAMGEHIFALLSRFQSNRLDCPKSWLPVVRWAFEHLTSSSIMLQLLVDRFTEKWDEVDNDDEDMEALCSFPRAFVVRAMRRLCELKNGKGNEYTRCYIEHASDDEMKACPHLHMQYDEEKGFGYFK